MENTEKTEIQNRSDVDPGRTNQPCNVNPPGESLVLRIGVTGHRTEPDTLPDNIRKRQIPNIPSIRKSVRDVLEVIRDTFRGVAETSASLFDLKPSSDEHPGGGTLRIISALASGADQWVAEEAIKLHYELQSVLPFDRDEYLKDFNPPSHDASNYLKLLSQAGEVLELDGKVDYDDQLNRFPDSRSYEAVGRALLNQSDILIAIWDGKDSHGKGGTGQVVREALQNGIPVVWIPWNSPDKWQLHLTASWRLVEELSDLKDDSKRLSELIEKMLLPPDYFYSSKVKTEKNLRKTYFNEVQKTGNFHHGIWLLFRNLICGEFFTCKGFKDSVNGFFVPGFEDDEMKKTKEKSEKTVKQGSSSFTFFTSLQNKINRKYLNHYAWANGLSVYYGNMYRGAFVMNYLLGAIAVFLALINMATGKGEHTGTWWILFELIVIVGILGLTFRGRRRQWHQRWIDYRTLAEYLRISRKLILFGGGTPRATYDSHLNSYGKPSQTWMYWHYRAIERAAGLLNLKIDKNYLTYCQSVWRDELVGEQVKYHTVTLERFNKIDRRLHHAGDFLFVLTLIACTLHLVHIWLYGNPKFDWIPEHTGGWLTLMCAFLPAMGAALAAIRSHGEVQRLAQRSEAMEENMKRLQMEIAKVPVEGESLNSVRLRYNVDRVSDLMTNEMLDWRVVFQDRPLGLPV